jgi:hypothetical protein
VINRDTGEATVVGPFGTHKGYLFSSDEGKGFFFVLEPNMGASVSTMIYVKAGETPVGKRAIGRNEQGNQARDEMDVT